MSTPQSGELRSSTDQLYVLGGCPQLSQQGLQNKRRTTIKNRPVRRKLGDLQLKAIFF